ncbi:hypothetical protein [uncultured Rikenella sp.]|uniref:hypothetical protein n=1 Tax=uncultured Rikenella sp. TaxID=368003 RepID=UPI0026175BA5|nr:hypothetical protein [uncultured Rikenella sp.]
MEIEANLFGEEFLFIRAKHAGMGAFFGGGDCREPAGRQGKNKRRSGAVNPGQEFQLTGSERNKGVVNPAFENFS